MFDKNENDTFDPNNKKQDDITTEYTQPLGDNIDPADPPTYEDSESFQCPFDMYRLGNDDDSIPCNCPHRPIQPPYPPQMPIRPRPQPLPYPPRPPIRPNPQPLPYPPRPIYPPNVHWVIHHHHHFYHNRPDDGRW